MCGRFALAYSRGQLERAAGTDRWRRTEAAPSYTYRECYNVAPRQVVPLLLSDAADAQRTLQPMKWSLPVLPWKRAASTDDHHHHHHQLLQVINVRAETALEKRTFRELMNKGKRAVVVASGFFEWYRGGDQVDAAAATTAVADKAVKRKRSVPYYIHMHPADGKPPPTDIATVAPMYMAAIYREYPSELNAFAVLTVAASDRIRWLHDRMPALLDTPGKLQAWLDVQHTSAADAMDQCAVPSTAIQWYAVSDQVSNTRNDCAELLQPRAEIKTNQRRIVEWFSPSKHAAT
ncbi:hypothetical protein CDCA_CDCA03G1106 [Cyanidium caldarium]|uniref:Embryonic stem cell-specific 5-hydroxymethylcytosine-binding protein n=1 Tax=Cyanidium caldarium TaxID=2771 RepID=A0AAV9ISL5_CYACA|nr:hypothetical protein CDCA_CDCA03G1106 [Cyanidium caldarium]